MPDPPPPVFVTPTPIEVAEGFAEGDRRYGQGVTGIRGDVQCGFVRDLDVDRYGALAERIVCVALCVPWEPSLVPDSTGDVGKGRFVRWTQYDDGCLIVRPKDSTPGAHALVTGRLPTLVIRGWLFGYEAKVPAYFRPDRYPAWWVPQGYLRPFRDRRLEREVAPGVDIGQAR